MVWVGAQCGIVVDALPGTHAGDVSECDYCGDGCEQVACAASEYEVAEDEAPEVEDWELEAEAILARDAEAESDEVVPSLRASGDIWERKS